MNANSNDTHRFPHDSARNEKLIGTQNGKGSCSAYPIVHDAWNSFVSGGWQEKWMNTSEPLQHWANGTSQAEERTETGAFDLGIEANTTDICDSQFALRRGRDGLCAVTDFTLRRLQNMEVRNGMGYNLCSARYVW